MALGNNPEKPEDLNDWLARIELRGYRLQDLGQYADGRWIARLVMELDADDPARAKGLTEWAKFAEAWTPEEAIKWALHNVYVWRRYSHQAAARKHYRFEPTKGVGIANGQIVHRKPGEGKDHAESTKRPSRRST